MWVRVRHRQAVFLLAGVLTAAGCTSDGTAPPGAAEMSPSPSVPERSTVAIGSGSGDPAPMVSDPAAEATMDLSSPEVAAEWLCTSVTAAPEQARVVVFERLWEEAVTVVGDEAAVDAALSHTCGDVVDPLR